MRSALQRPSRGAIAAGAGAVMLVVALALPWISIPGGDLANEALRMRGEAIPATGPAWRSLPLLSVLLVGLAGMASLVAVASSAAPRREAVAALATGSCGVLVLAALALKLFASRVAEDYTAVGAGGYLGLAAIAAIVLGCATAVLDLRAGRRPAPPRPSQQPEPEPAPWPRSWTWPAAAALAATYLATRLSFADGFPYFFDEGIYADHARFAEGSRDDLFIALEIGQGPLMTWLSVVWVKLGFAPLTAVRLVSVAAGLLTVAVVGLLGRWLWGATVAWVAAALCVVLPFFVVHDGIGIYEPLVTLIMASALLLQLALARRPDLKLAALLGLVLAAGLLTKQNTLPALALVPVSLLCFDWAPAGLRRRLAVWLAGVALVLVMVIAADLVQRASPYWDEREEAVGDILVWPVRSVDEVLDHPFALLDQNWDTYRPALVGYLTIPLLVAAAAGAVLAWRRDRALTLVLLAWLLVPLLAGMLFQLRPAPRHAMVLVPPLVLLTAYALVRGARLAAERLPRRAAVTVGAVGAVAILAPALVLDVRVLAHPATARYPGLDYWQYVAGWPAGGPWRETTELVEARTTGSRVVILTPGAYGILRLSLDDERYVFARPDDPLAASGQLALYDTAGFPVDPEGFERDVTSQGFREVARFARPSEPCPSPDVRPCGGAVIVFERR